MKNPYGRFTMVMAPSMITARLAAMNLVRNPANSARLSSNSVVGKIVLVRTNVKWD